MPIRKPKSVIQPQAESIPDPLPERQPAELSDDAPAEIAALSPIPPPQPGIAPAPVAIPAAVPPPVDTAAAPPVVEPLPALAPAHFPAAAPRQAPVVASAFLAAQKAVAGVNELETGGILTIDLAAIAKNWKSLAQRAVPADCAAVVKADAYGCGIDEVARHLAAAGCTTFFVAHLAEARRVRAAAPEAAIYVLNGFAPGTAPAFAEANARPVIGSLAEYVEWDAFRGASGWRGMAALHFDTGMNRLGLPLDHVPTFTTRMKMPDHGIALVMSHLACAETPNHPLNAGQIAAFRDLRFLFRGTATSLANSSGIFLGPAAHCDMVRPGAALYGINPTPGSPNLMEPVVNLKARIVQVREVAKGESVGYGATWTANKAARIAVVSAGYADGYLRAASASKSGTQAIIANRRCPLVGRISMDLMAFDTTGLPEALVVRGNYATLIGDGITVDEVAGRAATIAYEILTGLGRRYFRVWKR